MAGRKISEYTSNDVMLIHGSQNTCEVKLEQVVELDGAGEGVELGGAIKADDFEVQDLLELQKQKETNCEQTKNPPDTVKFDENSDEKALKDKKYFDIEAMSENTLNSV